MRSLPVYPDDLEVERERGRMCLVLLPDCQAIRWSLDAESDADSDDKKQREDSQNAVGNEGTLAMAFMLHEWIN